MTINKQSGFTLLELVVVVALLGLVTSLATNYVVEETEQSRVLDTDIRRDAIRNAINSYYLNNSNSFPDNLSDLVDSSKAGYPYLLDVDFEECDDSGTTKRIAVFRDGWGNGFNSDPDTSCSAPTFVNFGWDYAKSDSSVSNQPSLYSKGLDGVSKYPDVDYPITSDTFAGAASAVLAIAVSGANSTISCKQGASDVSFAKCLP